MTVCKDQIRRLLIPVKTLNFVPGKLLSIILLLLIVCCCSCAKFDETVLYKNANKAFNNDDLPSWRPLTTR